MAIIISVIILIIVIWLYFRNKKNESNNDEELDIPIFNEDILTELENEASSKLCKSIVELKLEQDGLQLNVNRNFRNEFKAISFDIFKIGLWKTLDKQIITYYLNDTDFIEKNCQKFLNELNIQISNKSIIVKPDRKFQRGGTLSYDESSDINEELYSFVHYWIVDLSNEIKSNYKLKMKNEVSNHLLFETKSGNELLEKLAKEGNIDSQYNLGTLYFKNNNFSMAKYWFEKAADNDEKESQYQLGNMYLQGIGLKKDIKKALFWYLKAAISNHPKAQYNIGLFYLQGEIIKQNENEGMHWLKKAANNGYKPAIDFLKQN